MANPLPPDYGPIRIRLLSQWCAFLPITIYERLASTRHKAKVYAIIRKIGNMPERVLIPLPPPSFIGILPLYDWIVAFKGQQDHVDQRFDDCLNPKLPHALPFNAKKGSAMKRILWDSEQPLTIARVTNRGSISVIGGFGQKATCKTCKRYEEETGVNGITAHPIFSLPPFEFVKGAKSVTNPTS